MPKIEEQEYKFKLRDAQVMGEFMAKALFHLTVIAAMCGGMFFGVLIIVAKALELI